jgi:DNA transposition AAA+ family ATPase
MNDIAITTETDIDGIRRQLNEIKAREGLTWTDIERASGVKAGTISVFSTGKYAGDNERIAVMVSRWLAARTAAAAVNATLPPVPGYRPTPSASEILALLRYAHVAQDLCVVVGVPGIGKTSAIDHYAATTPNVFRLTLEPSCKSVFAMLILLTEVMRITEKNPALLSQRIGAFLQAKEGLIIIDEAQHAGMDMLEQLRAFSDTAGAGVVLAGNHSILKKIAGGSGRGQYAQLASRVGMRLVLNKARKGDVDSIADAWSITDAAERTFIAKIAAKPGALRSVTKMMRIATVTADGAGETRCLGHLRQAWQQLAGTEGDRV